MLQDLLAILGLLTGSERKRFRVMVVVLFALTLFETFSVVSILPFLKLLSEPTLVHTNMLLEKLFFYLGFDSDISFIVFLGFCVLVFVVLGIFAKMATFWITTRFAMMRSVSLSSRLLARYLGQPYEWFLDRNSSDLGRSILSEADRVVSEGILPALQILPNFFSALLLFLALLILQPQVAIIGTGVLGLVYVAIFYAVRGPLVRIGGSRLAANKDRFRSVQDAFGSLKELKLLGLESVFLQRFYPAARQLAHSQTRGQILANLPRYAVEIFAFGGMILFVIILLSDRGLEVVSLVPTLGFLTAVGLRMIPALQQIYRSTANLRQSREIVNRIYADMSPLGYIDVALKSPQNLIPLPIKSTVSLRGATYRYPNSSRAVLDSLDLTIPANTTVGIVGATGSGKTTLVDVILGLLPLSEGELLVDGIPVVGENWATWQARFGYVPQTIFLTDATVAENIAFGVSFDQIDFSRLERVATIAALHDFVLNELPYGYQTIVGERGIRLSGGQKQRIGLARALYRDPSLIVLDEATSALDSSTERSVMDAVYNMAGSLTIIMIAHRITTLRSCDIILFMSNGRVEDSGTYTELMERNVAFRSMSAID